METAYPDISGSSGDHVVDARDDHMIPGKRAI